MPALGIPIPRGFGQRGPTLSGALAAVPASSSPASSPSMLKVPQKPAPAAALTFEALLAQLELPPELAAAAMRINDDSRLVPQALFQAMAGFYRSFITPVLAGDRPAASIVGNQLVKGDYRTLLERVVAAAPDLGKPEEPASSPASEQQQQQQPPASSTPSVDERVATLEALQKAIAENNAEEAARLEALATAQGWLPAAVTE